MGAKQRRQGHKLEKDLVRFYANVFNLIPFNGKNHESAQVGTTRQFSTHRDALGEDIYFRGDCPDHVKTIKVQAKKTLSRGTRSKAIDIQPLLDLTHATCKASLAAVLHARVTAPAGSREKLVADVVVLKLEDYEQLLKCYHDHNNTKRDSPLHAGLL